MCAAATCTVPCSGSVLTNASGESRLYFGCRHRLKDFLYREELGMANCNMHERFSGW